MNDQPVSQIPQSPKNNLTKIEAACIIAGLVIGGFAGYYFRAGEVQSLRQQVADLQSQADQDKTSAPRLTKDFVLKYAYGVKLNLPNTFGEIDQNETVIPLGTTGSYTAKSQLFTFDKNNNISVLVATDSVVYENFIKTGTQAITPNPNTLAPGNPGSINGVNFCASLGAKSCIYDEATNSATFNKSYVDAKNNQYEVWGTAKFFSVSQREIGKGGAIVITRVTSNNQDLINLAKTIAVDAKN